MASFPLCCNVCPKQPDFSDLSHLLTHISSKGHLSHYFKARVRSDQEPSIRQQLQIYDDWYEGNQLGKLLSQRMAEKETKATNARNKTAKSSLSRPAKDNKKAGRKRAPLRRPTSIVKQEDVLDPRLYQELKFPQDPSSSEVVSPSKLASMHRAYVPPMKGYLKNADGEQSKKTTLSRIRCKAQSNEIADGGSGIDQYELLALKEEDLIYPSPTTHDTSIQRAHTVSQSPTTADGDITGSVEDDGTVDLQDQGLTEGTRLKGIIWPGMDLFDSASPDAKRRRNQKKNGSILEHLMITSVTVQPTEIIFDMSGAIHKMRHISGQVESSPVRELVAPKPKERRPQKTKRPALREMNTNIPRRNQKPLDPRPNFSTTPHPSGQLKAVSNQGQPFNYPPLLEGNNHKHPYNIHTENSKLEWRSIAGKSDRKRKEGFKVYEDRETTKQAKTDRSQTPAQHAYQQNTPSYPSIHHATGLTEYGYNPSSTQGLHHLNSAYDPHHALDSNPGSIQSPGTMEPPLQHGNFIRNIPKNNTNKENIEPSVDQAGRSDNTAPQVSYSRSTQRYIVHDYRNPQFFDEPPAHLDFSAFHHPGMFGHTVNPLSYTFRQPLQPQLIPTVTYQHFSPPPQLSVNSSHHIPTVAYQHVPSPPQPVISPRLMMTRAGGPASENDNISDDETIDDQEGSVDWMHWL